LTIILSSCKLLESEIINESSDIIDVEVKAEEGMLKFYWSDMKSYNKWVEKIVEKNRRERFSIDTLNLKFNYLLYPTDTFHIKPAFIYSSDTLYLINKISFIKNSDTLIIDDYSDFNSVFFNKEGFYPLRLLDEYFKNE